MDPSRQMKDTRPRSLAFKAVERARKAAQSSSADEDVAPTNLLPGQMRLYPNYRPPLEPGSYEIEATQQINTFKFNHNESLTVANSLNGVPLLQKFEVAVSPFSIDLKKIDSFYPPEGHADEERVLPHVVFNDPHIPWDRSPKPVFRPEVETPRGLLPPWFALVAFDPSELALTSEETASLNIPPLDNKDHVLRSGAYSMKVSEYLTQLSSHIDYEPDEDASEEAIQQYGAMESSAELTNVIFPTIARAREVLSPTVKFSLMSHVREINTTGHPDAGIEDQGIFSVCISHVTGSIGSSVTTSIEPSQSTKPLPKTQVVHLVSIENFERSLDRHFEPDSRIGMVSLFSWTYLCVPPNPVNFKDTMQNLVDNMQTLKPPIQTFNALAGDQADVKKATAAQKLQERLSLGYSIGRWRVSTGEETLAFFRGPLTPIPTPRQPSVDRMWSGSSSTGKDYQILDRDLGVMDVTYSSAWQLGKLLAIQDTVFNSALLRFRSLIYKRATSDTRMALNGIRTSTALVADLTQTFNKLQFLQSPENSPVRNVLAVNDRAQVDLKQDRASPTFKNAMLATVDLQASATTDLGQQIYSDYGLGRANNPDWQIIYNWISDKLFLAGIPAHYMITDPSFLTGKSVQTQINDSVVLPPEALRFFYIDDAWMDCLLDGALSVANHTDPMDDVVRRRIKEVYNAVLSNTVDPPLPVKPPVPRYGFILRSSLIKVMPDIRIAVKCRKWNGSGWIEDPTRAALVRLTRMDEYTIFALLDCFPEEILHIRFVQPPHQQRFVAAAQLVPTRVHSVRKLYADGTAPPAVDVHGNELDDSGTWDPYTDTEIPSSIDRTTWYNPVTRCLDIVKMYTDILQILDDPALTVLRVDSTIMALELNDASYQIDVLPPVDVTAPIEPPKDRQIWTGSSNSNAVNDNSPHSQPLVRQSDVNSRVTVLRKAFLSSNNTDPYISTLARLTARLKIHPGPVHPAHIFLHPPIDLSRGSSLLAQHQSSNIVARTDSISTTTDNYFVSISMAGTLAPPLPSLDANPVYASSSFVPSNQITDLIFRLSFPTEATLPSTTSLASIALFLPIAGVEPLLTNPNEVRANMVYNPRLHPTISISLDQSNLIVTLKPRSGATSITSPEDASFVLKNVTVAPLTTPRIVSMIDENGVLSTIVAGECSIQISETYVLNPTTSEQSEGRSTVQVMKGNV